MLFDLLVLASLLCGLASVICLGQSCINTTAEAYSFWVMWFAFATIGCGGFMLLAFIVHLIERLLL